MHALPLGRFRQVNSKIRKKLIVLGNGQIWDIKNIDPKNPRRLFEELFSGRSLAGRALRFDEEYAKANCDRRIFANYLEEGKDTPTGMSVTLALVRGGVKVRKIAETVLKEMGKDGGRGIEALLTKTAYKQSWTERERNYWKGLDAVIIGGGVSRGKTGEILLQGIRDYLEKRGFSYLKLHQARFPGKEAGFIGAVANIIDDVLKEKFSQGTEEIGVVGIDLGRDKIGVGLLNIYPNCLKMEISNEVKKKGRIWTYRHSIKMPFQETLVHFKDSYKEYLPEERRLGERIRSQIVCQIVNLIIKSLQFAKRQHIVCSGHIGIASPGETDRLGYLVGSTHYLPFFQKKDGFWFKKEVEQGLEEKGYRGFEVHIVNDGIAAGLANLRFGLDFSRLKPGKYGFLGPGSGLGGFVAKIE